MTEHLKSLFVVLLLATVAFSVTKTAVSTVLKPGEFQRRRNLWFGITLSAFLAHNFWIFIVLTGFLLLIASSKDENKVSLVFFVLFAYPPLSQEIPGFGGIRFFFDMHYLRLIALAILVPAFIREMATHSSWKYFLGEISDKFLLSYLLLNVTLSASVSTFTGTSRTIFLLFLDVILPYFIVSRLAKDTQLLASAMASYVAAAAVLAMVGMFEFSKKWLLYESSFLGIMQISGNYTFRDDNLRAVASAGGPIVLGYAIAVGFCLLLGLRRAISNNHAWLVGLIVLVLGAVSSFSRGPWFGLLMGLLVFIFTGPRKSQIIGGRLVLLIILVAPVLMLTPLGDALIHPITVESESYTYRQRLLEIAIDVILKNPFFGAYDYIYSPAMQELKQGQGIIDIVNTYVAIGLSSGLIGLSLFIGFFISSIVGIWRRMRLIGDKDTVGYCIGRGLLATLTCILATIFTVSSVMAIPVIYYLVAGMAVVYSRLGWATTEKTSSQETFVSKLNKSSN